MFNLFRTLEGSGLRKQMLYKFLILFGISMFLLGVICVVTVVVTNENFKSDLEGGLTEQITVHTDKTIDGSTRYFAGYLTTAVNNLRIFAKVSTDTFRPGYSMGFEQSYPEYGDAFLKQPLVTDLRQDKQVSLAASGYYLPGFNAVDYQNLTVTDADTRDRSVHIDPFFINIYQQYTDFVSLYAGYENGLFRNYPGYGTLDTDPGRTYDPRVRGWYEQAKDSRDLIISDPYLDFNGRGWMITIAEPIVSSLDNFIVGVAGADLLISTITESIRDIKFLDSGKVTLFQRNGIVLADQEWDLDPQVSTPFSYQDLTAPPVPDNLWEWISATNEYRSGTFNLDGRNWVVTASPVQSFNEYVICVFIPQEEIFAPVTKISNEMSDVNTRTVGVLVGIIALVTLISVAIIYFTSTVMVVALDQARNGVVQIISSLGGPEYGQNIKTSATGVGTEFNHMNRQFCGVVDYLQQNSNDPLVQDPETFVVDHFAPVATTAYKYEPSAPEL